MQLSTTPSCYCHPPPLQAIRQEDWQLIRQLQACSVPHPLIVGRAERADSELSSDSHQILNEKQRQILNEKKKNLNENSSDLKWELNET